MLRQARQVLVILVLVVLVLIDDDCGQRDGEST